MFAPALRRLPRLRPGSVRSRQRSTWARGQRLAVRQRRGPAATRGLRATGCAGAGAGLRRRSVVLRTAERRAALRSWCMPQTVIVDDHPSFRARREPCSRRTGTTSSARRRTARPPSRGPPKPDMSSSTCLRRERVRHLQFLCDDGRGRASSSRAATPRPQRPDPVENARGSSQGRPLRRDPQSRLSASHWSSGSPRRGGIRGHRARRDDDHVTDRLTLGLAVAAGVAFVVGARRDDAAARQPNRSVPRRGRLRVVRRSLTDANNPWLFSIGIPVGGLAFVPSPRSCSRIRPGG
jgi:hypothetical protein